MDSNEKISNIDVNETEVTGQSEENKQTEQADETEKIDMKQKDGVESEVEKVVEDSINRRMRTEKGIRTERRRRRVNTEAIKEKDILSIEFDKSDVLFTIFLFVISFYCTLTISIGDLGTGFATFIIVFLIGTEFFFKLKEKKGNLESTFCFVGLIISAVMFLVFNNDIMELALLVVMIILLAYWIGNYCDGFMAKGDKSYIIGDIGNILFNTPFDNANIAFSSMKSGKSKKGFKNLGPVVLGVVFMIPVLVIVVLALMSADEEFSLLIHKIFSWVKYIDFEVIVKLVISIPVALYLSALVLGNLYNKHISNAIRYRNFNSDKEFFDYKNELRRCVPRVTILSALTSINFIYVLFVISQFGYLFKAFAHILPEEYTYSAYAKKGFFEMCFVVCVNILILVITRMITKRQENEDISGTDIKRAAQKFLGKPFEVTGYHLLQNVLLCIFTIILILTAESKMAMYINVYGLTRSRTYVSCIMVFVLFSMILITARQAKRFDVISYIVAAGVFTIMVMNVANIDGIIAKYNIHKYEKEIDANKDNAKLDFQCLSYLGDGAATALRDFYYSEYATTKDKYRVLCILFDDYYDYDNYDDYSCFIENLDNYMNDRQEMFESNKVKESDEYSYEYYDFIRCDIRGKKFSSFNITSFNKCAIRDKIYRDFMENIVDLEKTL